MKALMVLIAGFLLGLLGVWLPYSHSDLSLAQEAEPLQEAQNKEIKNFKANLPTARPDTQWASIESTNYSKYVENLKACGCPTDTISVIIKADLNAVLKQDQKQNVGDAAAALDLRRRQIRRQMDSLGLAQPAEPDDYFFSSAQLFTIRETLRRYPLSGTNANQALEKYNSRIKALGSLSSEQLIYYKSEFEEYGLAVRSALAGFRPSKDEYYRMISEMDSNIPESLRAKMSNILDAQRFAQYMEYQTSENLAVFEFSQKYKIGESTSHQLLQILKKKGTLSLQQYRNELRTILDRDTFDQFMYQHP
jgi:hypothetical protein